MIARSVGDQLCPSFIHQRALRLLLLVAAVNHAAVNMGVQTPLQTLLSALLGVQPGVELLGLLMLAF